MGYVIFSTKDKSETTFFQTLFKKMGKDVIVTTQNLEDLIFSSILEKAERSKKGSSKAVKASRSKKC